MTLKIKDTHDKSKKSKKIKKSHKHADTFVYFILDETGSMSGVRDATIDGFNEYVNGLRKDKKGKYFLSLIKFESPKIETIYSDVNVNDVPDLTRETYAPGGMTNLNDAIGVTLTRMAETFSDNKKKSNVLVVIMTDGHENASTEWRDTNALGELITRQEESGWTITFLGANMDAQKVSRAYNIDSSNAKSYSVQNMGATMDTLSESTVCYAATATLGTASRGFFDNAPDLTIKTENTDLQSDGDIDSLILGGNPFDIADAMNVTGGPNLSESSLATGLNIDPSMVSKFEDRIDENKEDDSDD